MSVSVSRDPFSRCDLVRVLVPSDQRDSCAWCGTRPGRFRYGIDHDRIHSRTSMDAKAFCCKECRDAYFQ